ncbi:MAG: hypothetical protein HY080_09570 [Gammaproteobacteria bacterium]|nr:hypothetical protein [Gammaproteobacteria bacterium]
MGFLATLFHTADRPQPTYMDSELGQLRWSEFDEAWLGFFKGFKYAIAYGYEDSPNEELLAYARDILSKPIWLKEAIDNAISEASEKFATTYFYEIRTLKLNCIRFYTNDDENRILVEFNGGKNSRTWKVEFRERLCEGMSYTARVA